MSIFRCICFQPWVVSDVRCIQCNKQEVYAFLRICFQSRRQGSGFFQVLDAAAFNQDIGGWDGRNVADMKLMLYTAVTFNQNIASWDFRRVIDKAQIWFSSHCIEQ
jgi:hypothetical protein